MKLITLDLDRGIPSPEAMPETSDLYRLYDQAEGAGSRFGLNFGEKYRDVWGTVRVKIRDDKERPRGITDWMETVPFKVVSQKLASVLRAFECECEFLPLIAEYRKNVFKDEYFALNVLRVIRGAIDFEKSQISDYDKEVGMAWQVEKLVLKDGVLGDAPIAYLFQIGRYAVSDELAAKIEDSGVVGCRLINPASFTI